MAYRHFVAAEHEKAFTNVIQIASPWGCLEHFDMLLIVIDPVAVYDVIKGGVGWRNDYSWKSLYHILKGGGHR